MLYLLLCCIISCGMIAPVADAYVGFVRYLTFNQMRKEERDMLYHAVTTPDDDFIWNAILEHEGQVFHTARGLEFSYHAKSNKSGEQLGECGNERSIRNGRYCAECMQPLENYCTSEEKAGHPCDPNDRYCRICGSPTAFQKLGLFPGWRESEQFRELKEREKKKLSRPQAPLLVIQQDGAIRKALQE